MENQFRTVVCPNCGANATNFKTCEHCGSMLVQCSVAKAKGIEVDIDQLKKQLNSCDCTRLENFLKHFITISQFCTDNFGYYANGYWLSTISASSYLGLSDVESWVPALNGKSDSDFALMIATAHIWVMPEESNGGKPDGVWLCITDDIPYEKSVAIHKLIYPFEPQDNGDFKSYYIGKDAKTAAQIMSKCFAILYDNFNEKDLNIQLHIQSSTNGWLGWGINSNGDYTDSERDDQKICDKLLSIHNAAKKNSPTTVASPNIDETSDSEGANNIWKILLILVFGIIVILFLLFSQVL